MVLNHIFLRNIIVYVAHTWIQNVIQYLHVDTINSYNQLVLIFCNILPDLQKHDEGNLLKQTFIKSVQSLFI